MTLLIGPHGFRVVRRRYTRFVATRRVGTFVLAAFLAGPGLHARCLLSCTSTGDPPRAPMSCHHDSAPAGLNVNASGQCPADPLQGTPAVARVAGLASSIAGPALVPDAPAVAPRMAAAVASALRSWSAGPPGAPYRTVLRI